MPAPAAFLPRCDPPFPKLPPTAASHFQLHFFATVYRLLHYLRLLGDEPSLDAPSLQPTFDRHPFLARYFAEIVQAMPDEIVWDDGLTWWDRTVSAWESRCSGPLPLRTLVETGGLSPYSRTAFVLAGLVEEDARFGSFFAELQAPVPTRRPCLELVGRVAGMGHEGLDPWAICRPLVEEGYVVAEDAHAPRAEWSLRVPGPLWDAVRGAAATSAGPLHRHEGGTFPSLDALVLPTDFLRRVTLLPELLRSGETKVVIVRGRPGSDRLTVLGALARALGRSLIVSDTKQPDETPLGPLATLSHALPVLRFEHAPGETSEVPALRGYSGPVGIVMGPEGGVEGEAVAGAVTLTIPPLGRAEREQCWRQALGDHAGSDVAEIAARFQLPGGYIRQAAPVAVARAALDGRGLVSFEDARAACRTLGRHHLDALAEAIDAEGTWDHLVMAPEGRAKLDELERRCRHREALLDHLGPAFGTAGRGVRALFSGPSGTGKTLAARLLAAELGMDLYRLDLAAVINKYIGETEKNLHRILATAEALDVVLLIDEGDALLGSRTDVKNANDRYANLETNYLLQRLEHYDGIVIVTTNLGENIDRAFQRRMDVTVDFVPPQPDERRRIWELHLPERHAVPDAVLDVVAMRCALTGGQIRNVAFHATLLALEASAPLGRRHLEEALGSEYRKASATCPLLSSALPDERSSRIEVFLGSLSP